jgi:predicted transcriptional regulator
MRTRLLLCAVTAGLVTACAGDHPVAVPDAPLLVQGAGAALDISGVWDYVEETFMVVKPAGEVLHLRCVSPDGILTINQTGSTFTGTLVHPTGSCMTKDGHVVPPPWDLPYEAGIEGRITGRALHIDQYDAPPGPPVHCPKQGAIRVASGEAVELHTTGRCDLSFLPFRPATATNSATATRP